jgi:O-antigen/teichoic acid export membrane protein
MDSSAVGVYHAGYSLANRTLDVIFIWLGSAAGPAAIAALEFGGRPALDKTAREQSSFMLLIAIPAAVGLALVARPLADLLVGEELRAGAARVTPWIAASGLFAGITTYYFHTAFTLAKATRLLLLAMTVPAAANIVLNVLLIPRFGLMGAVVATAISYALGLLASAVIGRRAIALPIPWDTLLRAGAASAVMALVVSLIPAFGGVLELALKAGAGGLVYGLVALALNAGGARSQGAALLSRLRAKVSPA